MNTLPENTHAKAQRRKEEAEEEGLQRLDHREGGSRPTSISTPFLCAFAPLRANFPSSLAHKILTVLGLVGATITASAAPERGPIVLGYERLQKQGTGQSAEAGEVLLSELSCFACHRESNAAPSNLVWKSGPDLSSAGDRLRASYVRQFLADPAVIKPGTTMPNLIATQPAAQRAELVEDLTHFVMQHHAAQKAAPTPAGEAEKGRVLFENIGCIACHTDLPLPKLGDKYAPGELTNFLIKPLAVRPAGRMPDLHLKPEEAADLAAHLTAGASAPEPAFAVDSARAARGEKAFQSLGCASCHSGAPALRTGPKAVAEGCLADNPPAGAPRYALTGDQRTAIRAALEPRTRNPRPESDAKTAVRQLTLQRNCFACHQRDGLGGPAPDIAAHFTSTKDDLGDLGRLPPPLDGVGRKLQPFALRNILRGEQRVRNYMRVRMPDFGPELSPALPPLFAQADLDPNETPTIATTEPNKVGRNAAGRVLVGTAGYACIACHELYGHPSLGIGAYDMAEMPKRLRPEWMRDFLLDPASFPTGARMPPFFPGGKPANSKLGGNAVNQIDSIRVYLTEVDQSLPPEGFLDPAAFELKPKDRPIVFRAFMKDASTHAIAVGYPQGVNIAFDANRVRWAQAWRGRFLDADGTWNQRVSKIEQPLGDAIIGLEKTGTIEIVGRDNEKAVYRGFRLDHEGTPTFLWDLGALHIEDRLAPGSGTGTGLKRSLRITGQTTEQVRFSAQPAAPIQVQVPGRSALPATLEFKNGTAEITEEISW